MQIKKRRVCIPPNMITPQVEVEAPGHFGFFLCHSSNLGSHVMISLYGSNTLLLIDKSPAPVAHILPIAIYCCCSLTLCPRIGTFQILKPRGLGEGSRGDRLAISTDLTQAQFSEHNQFSHDLALSCTLIRQLTTFLCLGH